MTFDVERRGLLKWLLFPFCVVSLGQNNDQNERNGAANQNEADDDDSGNEKYEDLARNLPTVTEIRKAIPRHCFEPKVSTSMYYVALDVAAIICLYFVFEWLRNMLPWYGLYFVTPAFWLIQGTFFTAIFVLGHDCGHDSFSRCELLNNCVGTVMHTFLMVPYYCWKLSHRNHHKNTGNIDKDEVFYPIRKRDYTRSFVAPGFGLGVGFYGYLAIGYGHRPVHHFNVFDAMFSRHVAKCAISVVCVGAWAAILYHYAIHQGFLSLLHHYLIPVFVFATWAIIFTFLHHTDENVPWFSDDEWSFVRGQLSSIDRDYGWAHGLTHTIGTHQIHHLFTKIPHYYLEEATAAFRANFPALVRYSSQPIIPTFVNMFRKWRKQFVIDDDVTVHTYK